MNTVYDCVILGAGAAGMTASIYASRYKISHLIFGDKLGGQFVDAHIIENYPGFTSIDGFTLTTKFREHVESYGVKVREEKVGELKKINLIDLINLISKEEPNAKKEELERLFRSLGVPSDELGNSLGQLEQLEIRNFPGIGNQEFFEIKTESGEKVFTRTLILAMGARHRALNIPGEDKYLGRGVSYCSTCDAPLFKGKRVAVVGGGNSAVTAALHLSEFAAKVFLIHRRDSFDKADPVWLDALSQKTNVTKILNTNVREIFGEAGPSNLEVVVLRLNSDNPILGKAGEVTAKSPAADNVRGIVLGSPFNGSDYLSLDGVFVEVGLVPAQSLANQIGVASDPSGYLKTAGDLSTNVAGVFAAGDLVKQSDVPQLRQIITSAGQGAVAAASVYAFLNQKLPAPDWG